MSRNEMEVVRQEGYLIWMTHVPDSVKKGCVMRSEHGTEPVVVVYVDREEDLVGILPMSEL